MTFRSDGADPDDVLTAHLRRRRTPRDVRLIWGVAFSMIGVAFLLMTGVVFYTVHQRDQAARGQVDALTAQLGDAQEQVAELTDQVDELTSAGQCRAEIGATYDFAAGTAIKIVLQQSLSRDPTLGIAVPTTDELLAAYNLLVGVLPDRLDSGTGCNTNGDTTPGG